MNSLLAALDTLLTMIPLEQAAHVVVRPQFTAVWCLVTLSYLLVCLFLLIWRTSPILRHLRRVTRALPKERDPHAFATVFESYQQTVVRERTLRHAWREFEESLVKPREGEAQRIRNTQEPSSYFNDATVVQPTVHNRFFDTVPSHLLGLGILGTFFGLAAGVGLASGNLNSENPTEVQRALAQLLSGASLAFMTSIVGLGSSLLFLFSERFLVGRVHRRLNTWVEGLEACVELVTPEHIALQQLFEQREQTQQLKTFNTDLIFSLEKALDERVAQQLVPQLERVVEAIDALRGDRAESNQAAMERLVEEFSRNLTGTAGREMEQMGGTLQTLGQNLQGLVDALALSQQQTRDTMDEASRNLRESLSAGSGVLTEKLEAAVDSVSRKLEAAADGLATQVSGAGAQIRDSGQAAAQGIAGVLGTFAEGVARLDRVSASQASLADRIAELADGLRTAGETVIEAHRGFLNSLQPSRDVARQLDAAGGRLADSLTRTEQLVEQAAAAARAIQDEQAKMATSWEDYASRFQGVDLALQRAFEQLQEGVERYTEQIRTFHTDVDQHMGKAIQNLASATAELQGTVEDLGDRLPEAAR